jgi:hypothetical protein
MAEGDSGEQGSGTHVPDGGGSNPGGETTPQVDEGIKAYIDQRLSAILKGKPRQGSPSPDASPESPRAVEEHVARLVREHTQDLDEKKQTKSKLSEIEAKLKEVMPKEKPKGGLIQRWLWGDPE